jgi:hypothetical protein
MVQKKRRGVEQAVNLEVFFPTRDDGHDLLVVVLKFFWVQDDRLIGILKQVGQYSAQNMVTIGSCSVKIKMR